MRGERLICCPRISSSTGSSPHARGTRARPGGVHGQVRFIPACAGNANARHAVRAGRTVHPRMRGERKIPLAPLCSSGGSSPHARGTPRLDGFFLMFHRFIPACAGNAFRRVPASGLTTVHPRMRGERIGGAILAAIVTGSSPHARGTRRPLIILSAHDRFIPACAGNARALKSRCWIKPVHPRMRGER